MNVVKTVDSSPAGYTTTWTFTTPGGTVTAQSGGSNFVNTAKTEAGQTNIIEADYAITASTDSSITTSGSGSYTDFSPAVGLQYTSFGTWSLTPCALNTTVCPSFYAGPYAGSKPGQSLTASMPTSGSATYTGGATGYVVQSPGVNSNNASEWWGTSTITANFGTGSVTGSITNIQAYTIQNAGQGQTALGTVNNIGFNATISGATYTGTTSVTGTAGTAYDIAGATGQVTGGFFGPSAAETAGTFYLTGGTNGTNLFGSFGAKPAPSDARLKTEVVREGSLPNGLALYSWRYLGGSRRFTGVMAQELLSDPALAKAVEVSFDGLMRVDYSQVGFWPKDFEAMCAEGEAAIEIFRGRMH